MVLSRIVSYYTSDHNQYLPIQAEVGNVIYFLLPFCGQWHCGWVGGCKAQKAAITISVWGADSAAELWHLSKPQPSPADSQPECHSMASHLPLILNEFYLRCEHQSEIYHTRWKSRRGQLTQYHSLRTLGTCLICVCFMPFSSMVPVYHPFAVCRMMVQRSILVLRCWHPIAREQPWNNDLQNWL